MKGMIPLLAFSLVFQAFPSGAESPWEREKEKGKLHQAIPDEDARQERARPRAPRPEVPQRRVRPREERLEAPRRREAAPQPERRIERSAPERPGRRIQKALPQLRRERLKELGVERVPRPFKNRELAAATPASRAFKRYPDKGPGGAEIKEKPLSFRKFNDPLVRHHMSLVVKGPLAVTVAGYNQSETQSGTYYWHEDAGYRYCHYYDSWGAHWYGWYLGTSFFWTRYYEGYWWWFDPGFGRWCYWWDGWWWWPGPFGAVYLYDGDHYTRSDDGGRAYQSPDGTRLVRVVGQAKDAFLYDSSEQPSFDPVYLESGVRKVEFFGSGAEGNLEMDLTLKDGSVVTFDANGEELEPE